MTRLNYSGQPSLALFDKNRDTRRRSVMCWISHLPSARMLSRNLPSYLGILEITKRGISPMTVSPPLESLFGAQAIATHQIMSLCTKADQPSLSPNLGSPTRVRISQFCQVLNFYHEWLILVRASCMLMRWVCKRRKRDVLRRRLMDRDLKKNRPGYWCCAYR